jgi:hypothetical protein
MYTNQSSYLRLAQAFILLLCVFVYPNHLQAQTPQRMEMLQINLVLKVLDLEGSIQKIREQMPQYQAFPKLIHQQKLIIRLPAVQLHLFSQVIEKMGVVVDKQLVRSDLTQELKQLEAGIKSKREILDQLQKLIAVADMANTLEIERQMRLMIRELEELQGKMRTQFDQTELSTIEISFTLPERQTVNQKLSSIPILNDLSVDALLRRF